MGRCRHPRNWTRYVGKAIEAHDSLGSRLVMSRTWCSQCREYISLGPSTDTPEMAIELAGAAIAAEWADENYRPGYDRFEWCPATGSDELCAFCQSRFLAHAIAEHAVDTFTATSASEGE